MSCNMQNHPQECPQMLTVLRTLLVRGTGHDSLVSTYSPVLLFLISLPLVSSLNFTLITRGGERVWSGPGHLHKECQGS